VVVNHNTLALENQRLDFRTKDELAGPGLRVPQIGAFDAVVGINKNDVATGHGLQCSVEPATPRRTDYRIPVDGVWQQVCAFQRRDRPPIAVNDNPERIVDRFVARPEAMVVSGVPIKVGDVAAISVVGLIGDPVPDDPRRQRGVAILGRLAAQAAQQSEFPKIPDVSGVPILHTIVTNIL
jgi:hypothetical protein